MLPSSGNVLDFRREREKMHVDMVVEVVEVMKGWTFSFFSLSCPKDFWVFFSKKKKNTEKEKWSHTTWPLSTLIDSLVYVTSISEQHGRELHESEQICIPSWHALWNPAHRKSINPHLEYRAGEQGDMLTPNGPWRFNFSQWKSRWESAYVRLIFAVLPHLKGSVLWFRYLG